MTRPRVRWPFLVVLALAVISVGVMRWWSHRPRAVTARALRSSAPRPRASAGCNRGADATPVHGASHRVDGRAVTVFGPAAPREPVPLALLLHGWHSNGAAFQAWFQFERHTGDDAFVVYPDSDGPLWDVLGDSDLDFLEHVQDEIGKLYCIDLSRVLLVGFSYGAKMTHHFGCKRPHLVTGIVAGGGDWVDNAPECGAALPVLVLHRTNDPSEKVEWGRAAARRWGRVMKCNDVEAPSLLGAGCTQHEACEAGGRIDFCEDTWFDPAWPADWNHTVRAPQRALAWSWFQALPESPRR